MDSEIQTLFDYILNPSIICSWEIEIAKYIYQNIIFVSVENFTATIFTNAQIFDQFLIILNNITEYLKIKQTYTSQYQTYYEKVSDSKSKLKIYIIFSEMCSNIIL